MIKFGVNYLDEDCEISLDTKDAEEPVERKYSGNPALVKEVKEFLSNAYGLFGHSLGEDSPAIDVQYALSNPPISDMIFLRVIEGQEILNNWKPPKFPKGVTT